MNEQEVEIVLAEDSTDDAVLTIHALKKRHLANNLVHVRDGSEALEFIFASGKYAGRNMGNIPKLILLDLKMPKVSGIEVLKKIKSDPRTKTIPVVVLTSSNEDPDIKQCYELGANSYIVKPVEFENFAKTVAELGLYWMIYNRSPK